MQATITTTTRVLYYPYMLWTIAVAIIFWAVGFVTGLAFAEPRPDASKQSQGGTPPVIRQSQSRAPTRPERWSK